MNSPKCSPYGGTYVENEDIPSWTQQQIILKARRQGCAIIQDSKSQLNLKLCEKVALWRGDITILKIDAIVNTTTEGYLGEFGVDAAVHSAAGQDLRKECKALRTCQTGEAKLTKGYKLPANYVIHTVGPVDDNVVDLKACYENSMSVMLSHGLKTIAFPCISTGERGFPREQAANVALLTVRRFLEENHNKVSKIIFCTFLAEDYQIYDRLMWEYFPIHLR